MLGRNPIPAVALTVALLLPSGGAQAFDDALYPDWSGGGNANRRGQLDAAKQEWRGELTPFKRGSQ